MILFSVALRSSRLEAGLQPFLIIDTDSILQNGMHIPESGIRFWFRMEGFDSSRMLIKYSFHQSHLSRVLMLQLREEIQKPHVSLIYANHGLM